MRICGVFGGQFSETGRAGVAVASRGGGQGWGGRAAGPRAGGPLGACRNPLGQHGPFSPNCPGALGRGGQGLDKRKSGGAPRGRGLADSRGAAGRTGRSSGPSALVVQLWAWGHPIPHDPERLLPRLHPKQKHLLGDCLPSSWSWEKLNANFCHLFNL